MQKSQACLAALIILTLAVSGCSLFREEEPPEVDLTEIFPDELPPIDQVQRLDFDQDGRKEWVVFYHVDLVQDHQKDSPIVAAAYRPVDDQDSRLPPHLVPALLWLPSQGYLCLYNCEADMRDVIGVGSPGKELVVLDKRGEDTVGVALFRWEAGLVVEGQAELGGFVPLGHFRADSIKLAYDQVTLLRRHQDRSDLATREIYVPQEGRYYKQAVRHVDDPEGQVFAPQDAEIVFALGMPEAPEGVKLPEKLVLALYQNYNNVDEIKTYGVSGAWDRLGGVCPPNACGCSFRPQDVSRVRVKQIAYEAEWERTTNVVVQVICESRGNQVDPPQTLTWSLLRQFDETWRLNGVVPGGDEYLCSPFGCPLLGSGE